MIIKRDKYLNDLISRQNNGMIKIITGIRRCGKSFLLFKLFKDYLLENGVTEDKIIEISLDDQQNKDLRNPDNLSSYIHDRAANDGMYYIFIDEAQFAISNEEAKDDDSYIGLYGVLNGLLYGNKYDVYITGSNSKFLSSDVRTEFRGRGDEVHIAPLTFSEYFNACGKDKRDAWREYTYYGGLPHILEENSEESKSNYLKYLCDEIYLRDIVERNHLKSDLGMKELMKSLSSSIGSLTNPQNIYNTFVSNGIDAISLPTIHSYLNYLSDSFIFEKAERFDVKGRKYLSTPSKYYCTDVGLRNALLNFRQYEENHIMENIIYNELIYRGFNVDVGVIETKEKDKENNKQVRKQLEIDFVCNKGYRRYYIQSAFAMYDKEKRQQEERPFLKIDDSFKKIIVVKDGGLPWYTDSGTLVIDLFDFLLDQDSLNT